MKHLKVKSGAKTIANVYFLNQINFSEKPDTAVSLIVRKISKSNTGYAGFKSKAYLKSHLLQNLFNRSPSLNLDSTKRLDNSRVAAIIQRAIRICYKTLPSSKPTKVFIFPTLSKFIADKMNGVSGYTPYKNTIHVYLHPKCDELDVLKETIFHEYNHSIVMECHNWETLLDSVVFEGLAEYFNRYLGGKSSPLIHALTLKKCFNVFNKVKKYFNNKNPNIYYSVFFENKKYPLWSGYALGYQIVKSFIKRNKWLSWPEIVILKPKEILRRSNFTK